MKTMPCGCRWDGHTLSRCARHREAGSLAADLTGERDAVPRTSNIRALLVPDGSPVDCRPPAWLFESAFRYALGRRRTGIIRATVDVLLRAWGWLPASMRRRMCDDVCDAVRRKEAGSGCDVEQWERLLARDAEGEEE